MGIIRSWPSSTTGAAASESRSRGCGGQAGRATGLTNLPLHDTAQNQIWLEILQIALDLLAWIPMLALIGPAGLWEPKRLRLRLFSAAVACEGLRTSPSPTATRQLPQLGPAHRPHDDRA
ncbi:hypothetical protein [Streptomyces malaysiensis]|uniref:hypothetical protein n=1 Tax=Streptomyces malaysiensis TaxID=92644 RepID=UPI000BFF364F|nr:hypothetical protein SMALA_4988 [Streptomyces malaysiensis]